MVSVEDLELFDLFQWLGKGRLAASLANCNQSTVSRGTMRVHDCFRGGLGPAGRAAPGQVSDQLLAMERKIHQLHHLIRQSRLRLHSTHWTNQILQSRLPEAWIVNPLQCVEPCVDAIELLDCHVIDALITEGIQRPTDDDERYTCFDLYQSPVQLVASPGSVLAHERGLSLGDVGRLAQIAPQDYLCRQAKECAKQLFHAVFDTTAGLEDRSGLAAMAWSIPTFSLVDTLVVPVDYGIDYSHRYVESLVVLKGNDSMPAVYQLVEYLRSIFHSLAKQGMAIAVN